MKLKLLLCILSTFFIGTTLFGQNETEVLEYIERYKGLAINEQIRSGVPAAITLAQGIHESGSGMSELATLGNNHFGIKCKSTWMGETILHDDDKKQECFRKYTNAEQSYIDHSDFLKANNRYHFLFDLDKTDYAAWASGLKRAGYATNPAYVQRLTDLVEKYNLQQYTYEAISKTGAVAEIVPNTDAPRNLTHVDDPATYYKGLKGFWASKGETLLPKALEKNIRYAKLLSLNDLTDAPLETDMFIFTEKKRRVGTSEFHIVTENESMLLISQKEAMLLSNLYSYNNLLPGQQPEVGEKLALQYKSFETPRTKQMFLKEFEPEKKEEIIPALATQQRLQEEKNQLEQRRIEEERIAQEQKRIEEEKFAQEQRRIAEEKLAQEQRRIEEEKIAQEQKRIEEEKIRSQEATQPAAELLEQKIVPVEVVKEAQPNLSETKNDEGILDSTKARRMEELLSSKPLDAKPQEVVMSEPVRKTETESPFADRKPKFEKPKEEIKPITQVPQEILEDKKEEIASEVTPVAIPAPMIPKRKYDEPNVDDSVKSLKKKFDEIVYSPRPVRRIDTPKKVDLPAPKTSPEVKKQDTKANSIKTDDKKSNVQVTQTGIKRDLKKTKSTSSKDVISSNGKGDKKTDSKKNAASSTKDKKEKNVKGKKENADKKNETVKKGNKKADAVKQDSKKTADKKNADKKGQDKKGQGNKKKDAPKKKK